MTLMWMYGGYAWLTSNLAIEGLMQRLLLFIAMAAFFIMALAIPDVFRAGGLPYSLGLLTVTAIHAYLFSTVPASSSRAIWEFAPFNFASTLLVLAAAFVNPPWDWPLWSATAIVVVFAAIHRRESYFQLSPAHFVERNGLLVIIALGESVVAIGLDARGLPVDLRMAFSVMLALLLSAAVWWNYFDSDDRIAEHRFTIATAAERARMAVLGFTFGHIIIIAGIVLFAAGLAVGISHPTGSSDATGLWNIDSLYRHVVRIGPVRPRLLIAALMFATVPIWFAFGALVQIAACLILMQPLWILERKRLNMERENGDWRVETKKQ